MTTNKIVNILGGGLFCASVLLLVLWAFFGPPHLKVGLVPLIGIKIEWYFLTAITCLLSGFILSVLTPNEDIERHYLRFGLFLGIIVIIFAAGYTTWEVKSIAEVSIPVIGGTYRSPPLPWIFFSNLISNAILLIMTTVPSSIGYWLGTLFRPSKT